MKEKSTSAILTIIKLAVYALVAFLVLSMLQSCGDGYEKHQEQRENEIIYNFMDDYGNTCQRIIEETANADDLRQDYFSGEIDEYDILNRYEELRDMVAKAAWNWEDTQFKKG